MKVVQDILFPLNITGKDRKVVAYDLSGTPAITPPGIKTVNVQYTGDCVKAAYTIVKTAPPKPDVYENGGHVYMGGGSESFIVPYTSGYGARRRTYTVYFNCINVTSLIVNGEQLI